MQISQNGLKFIGLHEGFRERAYLDAATPPVLTIGYGFTWRSNAFRSWWSKNRNTPFDRSARITHDEALECLKILVDSEYGKAVNKFLGRAVPQHVYDGMVSAVFNLGPGALKWRWAAACKAGNYADAAAKLRVTGTTAGGKRLPGLVRRRAEEALLIEKGIYTGVKQSKHPFPDPQKAPDEPFLAPPDYVPPKPKPAPVSFWRRLLAWLGFINLP